MQQNNLTIGVEKKRFVRRPEGAKAMSLGLQTFDKLAVEANAKIHIGRVALYDLLKVTDYIESLSGKSVTNE